MTRGFVLDPSLVHRLLDVALRRGGHFADLYAEARESLSLRLEDGRIEQASNGVEYGAAIRVIRGESTVFGYVDSPNEAALFGLAGDLANQVGLQVQVKTKVGAPKRTQEAPGELDDWFSGLEDFALDGQVLATARLLHVADEVARSVSSEVRQVIVSFSSTRQRVWIANSEGAFVTDVRPRTALSILVAAQRGSVLQTARDTLVWIGESQLVDESRVVKLGEYVARTAVALLDARPAPAGRLPVVIANGFGGVLFHEACGHGLEADHVAKQSSVWQGKLGQRVAPPYVSAFDDGTLPGMWGSSHYDDEGTPCQRTALIEEGILVGYLTDRLRARQLGLPCTGNGRRQDYRSLPYPRMTNTFIAPGSAERDELIADTKHGLYAKSFSGGQVNPATGDFVFSVEEGYLIENGRISGPVRGATLIGSSQRVLECIDGIANDVEIRPGTCGKEGQSVPVGTGQPTLRVRELTVGGTDL
ncbi:MAG: TldD/PmbA family protein [Thermoleophilia bacterium]|nr:TldD/PmbA family protein [Thermoleophilia bacterium]